MEEYNNMEEYIKKIIEIEHEAQKLVSQGYEQTEKIRSDTLNELKNMEDNIMEMSIHKIDQLRERNRLEANEKIQNIKESTENRIRILEDYVEKNREMWENLIFDRILRR